MIFLRPGPLSGASLLPAAGPCRVKWRLGRKFDLTCGNNLRLLDEIICLSKEAKNQHEPNYFLLGFDLLFELLSSFNWFFIEFTCCTKTNTSICFSVTLHWHTPVRFSPAPFSKKLLTGQDWKVKSSFVGPPTEKETLIDHQLPPVGSHRVIAAIYLNTSAENTAGTRSECHPLKRIVVLSIESRWPMFLRPDIVFDKDGRLTSVSTWLSCPVFRTGQVHLICTIQPVAWRLMQIKSTETIRSTSVYSRTTHRSVKAAMYITRNI